MKLDKSLFCIFLVSISIITHSVDIFHAIELQDKKLIAQALKETKNVNAVNDQGETPLMVAVKVENCSIVKQLLKHKKIEVNYVDNVGKTALDYGVEFHNKNIVHTLLKKRAKLAQEENVPSLNKLIRAKKIFIQALTMFFGALLGISIGCTALLLSINGAWAPLGVGIMTMGTTLYVLLPLAFIMREKNILFQNFLLAKINY